MSSFPERPLLYKFGSTGQLSGGLYPTETSPCKIPFVSLLRSRRSFFAEVPDLCLSLLPTPVPRPTPYVRREPEHLRPVQVVPQPEIRPTMSFDNLSKFLEN